MEGVGGGCVEVGGAANRGRRTLMRKGNFGNERELGVHTDEEDDDEDDVCVKTATDLALTVVTVSPMAVFSLT